MGKGSAPEWFLEVEGNKSGPYTAEQIQGLLEDGEILPQHRVTATRLRGEWITAEELVAAFKAAIAKAAAQASAAAASGGNRAAQFQQQPQRTFEPPPRPAGIDNSEPAEPSYRRMDDATRDLFDALQAARERKTASKMTAAQAEDWGKLARAERRYPPQLWLIVALTLVLGGTVWGVMKLLPKNSEPTAAVTERGTVTGARRSDTTGSSATPGQPSPSGANLNQAVVSGGVTAPAPVATARPRLFPPRSAATAVGAGNTFIRPAPPVIQPPRAIHAPRNADDPRRDDRDDRRDDRMDDRDRDDPNRDGTDSWRDRAAPVHANDDRSDLRGAGNGSDRANDLPPAGAGGGSDSNGFQRSEWGRDEKGEPNSQNNAAPGAPLPPADSR